MAQRKKKLTKKKRHTTNRDPEDSDSGDFELAAEIKDDDSHYALSLSLCRSLSLSLSLSPSPSPSLSLSISLSPYSLRPLCVGPSAVLDLSLLLWLVMSLFTYWIRISICQDLPKPIRANFILNVETDELFITAGLQDRVVQVYEGLVYMDFSKKLMEEQGYGNYVSMEMSGLPPFWLAYLSDPSDSGRIHSNIRQRWLSGEALVVDAMKTFAELTDEARTALQDKDWRRLAQLMDQNFELRRSVYTDDCLGPGNLKMVELARQFGSAVKLPGSGGAVVGLCLDEGRLVEMRQAFQEAGCVFCVITPYNPSASAVGGQH